MELNAMNGLARLHKLDKYYQQSIDLHIETLIL